ncbi:MAG: transglutaminase-like domain-containing protein [Promethearchaeota archaeon]
MKPNKKHLTSKYFIILSLIFLPLILYSMYPNQSISNNFSVSKLFRSAGENAKQSLYASSSVDIAHDSPNGFSYQNNLTYRLDYTWRMTNKRNRPFKDTIEMWFQIINNQTAPQHVGKPEILTSKVVLNSSNYANFTGAVHSFDKSDDYNNTYEYFKVQMNEDSDALEYNVSYIITARETIWNFNEADIGDYNVSDPLYINYTGKENMFNVDDGNIINLVNEITAGKTSVIAKAQAIYDWITDENNMEYAIQATEKNATQTFIDREGDCSEFSNLMITMLRIAGIPARKLCGIAIVESLATNTWVKADLSKGNTISYSERYEYGIVKTNTIPGHAWVEFYVPNYGWVSCDPTFGFGNRESFMFRTTEIHLPFTIGENFGGGIDPNLPQPSTELAILPYLWAVQSNVLFQLDIKITILDVQIYAENYLYLIVVGIAIITVVAIVIYAFGRRKAKAKSYSNEYSDYGNYSSSW